MTWNVEVTDEFGEWYGGLSEAQQDDITAAGLLLIEQGPKLPFPYVRNFGIEAPAYARAASAEQGGGRCEYSTPLIRDDRQSCSLAGIRRATIASMSE